MSSKSVRHSIKLYGKPRSVELDVWDLGGRLDFTWRARAGALSGRVKEATHGVTAVGVLPPWFSG